MTKSRLVARCLKSCLNLCLNPGLISCLIVLLPLALNAADPTKVPRTPLDQIHFDPSTTRAFDRSGKYVTTRVKADGTVQTEVNGSFQNVTVARMGPNGDIETYCTTSEQDAKNWMARVDGRPDSGPSSTTISPPAQDKTP